MRATRFSRINDMNATLEGGCPYLDMTAASFDDFDLDEDRLELGSREGVALTANFASSTSSGSIRGFAEDDGTPFDIALTMPKQRLEPEDSRADSIFPGGRFG